MVRRLRDHDPRFEVLVHRGKGSERMVYHPDIDGSPRSHPVKCHGDGTELRRGVLRSIIRRFGLPGGIFG
jgi:hypothetical protein